MSPKQILWSFVTSNIYICHLISDGYLTVCVLWCRFQLAVRGMSDTSNHCIPNHTILISKGRLAYSMSHSPCWALFLWHYQEYRHSLGSMCIAKANIQQDPSFLLLWLLWGSGVFERERVCVYVCVCVCVCVCVSASVTPFLFIWANSYNGRHLSQSALGKIV